MFNTVGKRLLLNVCCAPCALPIIDRDYQDIDFHLFFWGSNIYPKEEYQKRLAETRKVATLYHLPVLEVEYDHNLWLDFLRKNLSQPLESYAENEERCLICFRYRLEKTVAFAQENGFKIFATTLSLSCFKDTFFIDHYAKNLAVDYDLEYYQFPLDPKWAYQKGIELSKKYNVYRQKYCGCEFSKK